MYFVPKQSKYAHDRKMASSRICSCMNQVFGCLILFHRSVDGRRGRCCCPLIAERDDFLAAASLRLSVEVVFANACRRLKMSEIATSRSPSSPCRSLRKSRRRERERERRKNEGEMYPDCSPNAPSMQRSAPKMRPECKPATSRPNFVQPHPIPQHGKLQHPRRRLPLFAEILRRRDRRRRLGTVDEPCSVCVPTDRSDIPDVGLESCRKLDHSTGLSRFRTPVKLAIHVVSLIASECYRSSPLRLCELEKRPKNVLSTLLL